MSALVAASVARAIENPLAPKIDASDERELGYEFDRQLRDAVPQIHDLQVLEFVEDLGQLLVDRLGEQPFDYRFRVVVDPSLNAFAVPGGYIYFHTGTLLSVGDVEELVGVLSHELAHVKGRHWARTAEATALPKLLTQLAGIAASAATGHVAPMLAAQGVNVALELQHTREHEDEADRVGAVFMTRSGWDPAGMMRFFERIQLLERRSRQGQLPPYLYSHPDVDQRIDVVRGLSESLRPVREPPDLDERFAEMQSRLALLVGEERSSWDVVAPYDAEPTDPLLKEAARLVEDGQPGQALEVLVEAEAREPMDPRVPFRRAQILEDLGRTQEAIYAYRRTVRLDPNRATVFLSLGRAHKALGQRRQALFFLDQAIYRANTRRIRTQAQQEIERIIFPVVTESGWSDGAEEPGADSLTAHTHTSFDAEDDRAVWWAQLGPHYEDQAGYLMVRWVDPTGRVVEEDKPRRRGKRFVTSSHRFADGGPKPGSWTLQLLLGKQVVHEDTFAATSSALP